MTNHDTSDQTLVVKEKEKDKEASQEVVVKPSQVLDICQKGCTIKMSDGEEYEFDGTEVVSIEEGLMFLDEPSDAGAPDVGAGGPADPPAASENAEPSAEKSE